MRIIIFTFLSILLLTSCKKDPNKNISEGKIEKGIYHNEEIGWTIKVPDGWDVIKQDIQQGLDAINETAGVEYDVSGLKQLLNFKKDHRHIFQSTIEPFELKYEGEWEENNEGIKELLYMTYNNNGIKIDTSSSKEKIDKLEFNVFHITMYGPDGNIMLYQDMYGRYHKGYDLGVNLNYFNDKEKDEMMRVWKNSKFK